MSAQKCTCRWLKRWPDGTVQWDLCTEGSEFIKCPDCCRATTLNAPQPLPKLKMHHTERVLVARLERMHARVERYQSIAVDHLDDMRAPGALYWPDVEACLNNAASALTDAINELKRGTPAK